MNHHPMDDFPVRPLRFEVDQVRDEDIVWSDSSPDFALFINAFGVHVPYFERFLVAVMREYREELGDPQLKADVRKIIGQEAHHAFNFVQWTQRMCRKYPGLAQVDQHARESFEQAAATASKRYKIGFTAGYETFTFLAGMIILDRYQELMAKAQPNIRAMWVWHQVEEVEHGAVAFDFYSAFYPDDHWFRRTMVFWTFCHMAKEAFMAFRPMVKVERKTLGAKLRAWRFFGGFAKDLFVASLPVYRKSYHPRRHPICNEAQNPVAVAWRAQHEQGGDVLSLSDAQIAKMLAEQQPSAV